MNIIFGLAGHPYFSNLQLQDLQLTNLQLTNLQLNNLKLINFLEQRIRIPRTNS